MMPRENDAPWGAEVDAQQDADADAEHTPPRKCEQCAGFGVVYVGYDDEGDEPCFACNGTGEV